MFTHQTSCTFHSSKTYALYCSTIAYMNLMTRVEQYQNCHNCVLEKESNHVRFFPLPLFLGKASGSLIVIQSTYTGTSLDIFFSQKQKKIG